MEFQRYQKWTRSLTSDIYRLDDNQSIVYRRRLNLSGPENPTRYEPDRPSTDSMTSAKPQSIDLVFYFY